MSFALEKVVFPGMLIFINLATMGTSIIYGALNTAHNENAQRGSLPNLYRPVEGSNGWIPDSRHGQRNTSTQEAPHKRFQTNPYADTLSYIALPCAGNVRAVSHGSPSPRVMNRRYPRELLESLSREALLAEQLCQTLLRRYEETGINHLVAMQHSSLMPIRLGLFFPSGTMVGYNREQVAVVLKAIYKELARSAVMLQGVINESMRPFVSLMKDLKEYSIYNLICGVSVVMESQNIKLTETAVDMTENARPRPVANFALRFVRDYIALQQMALLFRDISSKMTAIAQHT